MQAEAEKINDRIPVLEEKDLKNYWDERADSYSVQIQDELRDGSEEACKQILLSLLPQKRGSLNVLDVGCGPGFFSIMMAQEGHAVTGADMSSSMLREAEKNAESRGISSIHFVQAGAESLPFPESSFDLILARNVTWMLTRPEQTLAHWFSRLRPGGKLLYFDAEWYNYLNSEEEYRKYKNYQKSVRNQNSFIYEKENVMEEMARDLPMTYCRRPKWDIVFWNRIPSAEAAWENNLNSVIYGKQEQLEYRYTPMFLIDVKRKK